MAVANKEPARHNGISGNLRNAAAGSPFVVTYKGTSKTVELPEYYPENGDEGIHVGNDMAVTDAAIRMLKEEVEGIPSPATVRRVRKKLKLSQREAGGLLKVGENAFDKPRA